MVDINRFGNIKIGIHVKGILTKLNLETFSRTMIFNFHTINDDVIKDFIICIIVIDLI